MSSTSSIGAGIAARLGVLVLALSGAGGATAAPVVRATGTQLTLAGKPFRVYGFNYDFNGTHPNIDYIHAPSRKRLLRLRADFAEARRMGANTIRVYLELHDFMASPTRTRPRALRALRQILREAERAGILLDVTGNLAWHADRSPEWYDALSDRSRWRVQAAFWRAVAAVGARSPNVLAYELTSEPTIGASRSWYAGLLVHHYVQYIVRDLRGRNPVVLARAWTRTLRDAIRSRDRRHLITIGLLPVHGWAFDPANVADLLDVVTVHEYPGVSDEFASIAVVRAFAAHGKPLLLGETFAYDRQTALTFLLGSRAWLAGSLSFYDGRAPDEVAATTVPDALYRENLLTYLELRDRVGF